MKKIGEIRTAGPFGTPLKDFWGKPKAEIYADAQQSDDALRRQSEEFARQIQDLKSSQEFAAEQVEYAMAQAAEDIEKSISNQWILQSRKKVEKAEELLRAGLVPESLKLCSDAMSQDPSNMDSYIVASVAYGLVNETEKSKECLRKTIYLLRTSEYKSDVQPYLGVLENILESEYKGDLIPDFLEALKSSSLNLYAMDYFYDLTLKLTEVSPDWAIALAKRYFIYWTNELKEKLSEGNQYNLHGLSNYFYSRACYIDIHKRLKKEVDFGTNVVFDNYLGSAQIDSILNPMKTFDIWSSKFLPETKDFIRQELQDGLKSWEADVINEKRSLAKSNAEGFRTGWGWFWFWLLSFGIFGALSGEWTTAKMFITMGLAIIPPIIIHFLKKSIREQNQFNEYMNDHNDRIKPLKKMLQTSHGNDAKDESKSVIPASNFCQKCGAKVQSDDKFCQECGNGLG